MLTGLCARLLGRHPAPVSSPDTGVVVVTAVFGLVTVVTMTLMVAIALKGLQSLKMGRLEPYGHALAGSTILACGLGIALLGL